MLVRRVCLPGGISLTRVTPFEISTWKRRNSANFCLPAGGSFAATKQLRAVVISRTPRAREDLFQPVRAFSSFDENVEVINLGDARFSFIREDIACRFVAGYR